ncbi:hypothetical protein [Pseudocolwellia agarivorans]|uniref:hypothetical protein n=1 Tax=Pseudocolwellia agarivorans TaxID=1911682 RepID=UPI00098585F6|nr:hypothetical protein [Pseudocolwellia agarivorans]
MKLTEVKSPLSLFLSICGLLTLLMIATRGNHFSTFNSLPSASTAVFFLAGMYLRKVKDFWFFYILSITIDLASSFYRGQFGDCLTASYPALAFSYAAMFAAGYYVRPDWSQQNMITNIVKVSVALIIASSIAFFISNGSYYAFSGKFPDLSWAEYATRVNKYFFKSVSNPVFYVATGIVMHWCINRFFTEKTTAQLSS